MDQDSEAAIRSDFEDWSGGFPPESDQQIFVYVTTASSKEWDDNIVLEILRTWMTGAELSAHVE